MPPFRNIVSMLSASDSFRVTFLNKASAACLTVLGSFGFGLSACPYSEHDDRWIHWTLCQQAPVTSMVHLGIRKHILMLYTANSYSIESGIRGSEFLPYRVGVSGNRFS